MKVLVALALLLLPPLVVAAGKNEISVSGSTFLLNGRPFPYTGISFFNAVYNPAFNKSGEERRKWLEKFRRYGINVLRVWAQWDSRRGYADTCDECTLYFPDGRLRPQHVERLKAIVADADELGMVIELVLFSQESWHAQIRLGPAESERAITALAKELLPYRNLTIQIWNEFSERVVEHVKTVKSADPKRLVTNSPGGGGTILAERGQYEALDYLTPHTSRQRSGKPWEIAPLEIAYLLKRYSKPVVDDEPARTGTPNFGGPPEQTSPYDHILHIYQVCKNGGYITYHHDMFQTGYGTPAVPPHGVPDPEFSPYHRLVLEFIALRQRYQPGPPAATR